MCELEPWDRAAAATQADHTSTGLVRTPRDQVEAERLRSFELEEELREKSALYQLPVQWPTQLYQYLHLGINMERYTVHVSS